MKSKPEFVSLPVEVRLLIYEAIPHDGTWGWMHSNLHAALMPKERPRKDLALLASTNKTLREEITPILFDDPFVVYVRYSWPLDTTDGYNGSHNLEPLPLLKKVKSHLEMEFLMKETELPPTVATLRQFLDRLDPSQCLRRYTFTMRVVCPDPQFELDRQEAQSTSEEQYGTTMKGELECAKAVMGILEQMIISLE